jgi:hypothetical protein
MKKFNKNKKGDFFIDGAVMFFSYIILFLLLIIFAMLFSCTGNKQNQGNVILNLEFNMLLPNYLRTTINQDGITPADLILLYNLDGKHKNDIACSLKKSLESQSIYGYLYINNDEILKYLGNDCEETFYTKEQILPSIGSQANILLKFKFYNCDPKIANKKNSPTLAELPHEINRLNGEISDLESSGDIYDSDCESIDQKRQILEEDKKTLGYKDPIRATRTSEEIAIIEKIISDNIDIMVGSNLYKYQGNGYWRASNGADVTRETLKINLIGEQGYKVDVLNAKKDNNIWEIP